MSETIVVIASIIILLLLIGSIWSNVFLIKRLLKVSENIDDLLGDVNNFRQHLEKVHRMESYYGDETLHNLIQHSKDLVDIIEEFAENYEGNINYDTEAEKTPHP
jgi:hypothetical protein